MKSALSIFRSCPYWINWKRLGHNECKSFTDVVIGLIIIAAVTISRMTSEGDKYNPVNKLEVDYETNQFTQYHSGIVV